MGVALVNVGPLEIDFAKKRVHILTGYTLVLAFLIMCLGSYVRNKDAGLSCPDWPLCYGTLIPYFDFRIFLEWFHRLLAGFLVIGLLSLTVKVIWSPILRRLLLMPLAAAMLLLVIKVILGGLTVLQLIDPKIVSLHLINAVLFFGVLTWIFFLTRYSRADDGLLVPSWGEWFITLTICAGVFCQIFLGGVVSTNFAGTVCPDFPRCFGHWWPGGVLMNLQMLHRYMGFILFLLVVGQSIVGLMTTRTHARYQRIALIFLPALVMLQICLGVINVWYTLPATAVLAHLGNAIGIFAISLIHCLETSSRLMAGKCALITADYKKRVLTRGTSI